MKTTLAKSIILLSAATCMSATIACQRKERVLDVQTPAGDLKVDRDKKTGDVEIKIDEKK